MPKVPFTCPGKHFEEIFVNEKTKFGKESSILAKSSDVWQKIFFTVVKTAFYMSRGNFSDNFFFEMFVLSWVFLYSEQKVFGSLPKIFGTVHKTAF